MTKSELINQIDRIITFTATNSRGGLTQAREFVSIYVDSNSQFLKSLNGINIAFNTDTVKNDTTRILFKP